MATIACFPKNCCVYLSKIIPCLPPRGPWLLRARIPCQLRQLASHRTAPLGPQRWANTLGLVWLPRAFCEGGKGEAQFTWFLFSDQEERTNLSYGIDPFRPCLSSLSLCPHYRLNLPERFWVDLSITAASIQSDPLL